MFLQSCPETRQEDQMWAAFGDGVFLEEAVPMSTSKCLRKDPAVNPQWETAPAAGEWVTGSISMVYHNTHHSALLQAIFSV